MYVMIRRCLLLAALLLWPAPLQTQDAAAELHRRVNSLRASLGVSPSSLNSALVAAARDHARWMAASGLIQHTRPDGNSLRDRTRAAGYSSSWVAEVIFMGANLESAWTFWLGSKIHYDTITGPALREMGVGHAAADRRSAYVIVFGNPGGPPLRDSAAPAAGVAPRPPSYVRGRDSQGFILHEVQPGDSMGSIALLYGYTWDDLPYMREVNSLENDLLQPGQILRVPPAAGTFTATVPPVSPPAPPFPPPLLPPLSPPFRQRSRQLRVPSPPASACRPPSPVLPGHPRPLPSRNGRLRRTLSHHSG